MIWLSAKILKCSRESDLSLKVVRNRLSLSVSRVYSCRVRRAKGGMDDCSERPKDNADPNKKKKETCYAPKFHANPQGPDYPASPICDQVLAAHGLRNE